MINRCDNMSVGVILERDNMIALIERAKFPFGFAPPAGHVDDHGSPEMAAIDEVFEEIGITISLDGLTRTVIENRRLDKSCRRPGGDHHNWWVFTAGEFEGDITASDDETRGASWVDLSRLQELADRTKLFQAGVVSDEQWQQSPGLEEVWLGFFAELRYVD